ncbi:FYVE and coiled-coil domain-containing protein 1-like [Scyliorhinus canicula]|uniref:FYVE and coiled-coil domain-containing protein 1-like n=1 Tax=Scyliorhinus canicula TaxID=7830 RepID=UPI0018F37F3D|nr:FYVE and coiled-coil domain-containing protein 1-like [Scyliorhinus canicula]
MAADTDVQLLKVVKDLQDSIQELCKEQERNQQPITDANPVLYRLCMKLEYLLQYDQKEKKDIFGNQKDYWDYICVSLNSHKCGTDALKCINHTTRLKTSMGKGRAFIRYSLVQQQLADLLQLCFLNQDVASNWYYARNPFLSERLRSDITEQLYSLNGINFDLALEGVDLDTAWPLGSCDFKTPRRTSGDRIPFSNPFKVVYRKARNGPTKEPEHEKTVVTSRMKEAMGTEAQGALSGTSAQHGASSSLDVPQESQEQILETSPDSGDGRSDSGQQGQSEHDVQTSQQGQNIGLVSNLDQTPNGSELPRGIGQTDNAQRPEQFVTIVTSDERGVTELKVVAEQKPPLEKLNEDLMEKQQMIEQLNHLLKEKERIHGEESSKLQQEIANLQEMQKKSEEQSKRLDQLEDSNKFLNETVEEMDGILDQLKQTMAQKDHENMLLRKEQVEKMATAQQFHEEELEKLKLRLGEHPKESNGAKWDVDERLKIVSEEQSILAGFQSKTELETGQKWAELEEPGSKVHDLESLNNSLEEKYRASQQKVKDLEMSVMSLQSEVNRIQGLDQSGAAVLSPAGKELKLEVDDGNVEEIQRVGQIELVNPELERDELMQEESTCSESLAASKQEHRPALLKVPDLAQQLEKHKEREESPKNPNEDSRNTAAKESDDLKVWTYKLAETNRKFESSHGEESDAEEKLETVAQLHMSTAENRATESEGQREVLAEEVQAKLATPEGNQEELVVAQTENAEMKHSLQERAEGKASPHTELTSVLPAPEESGQEVVRIQKQLEELENSHRLEVQGMLERIETVQAERETLEQQKEELRKKVSLFDEELLELRESVRKLGLANAKAQGETERAQAERERLRAQLVKLSSEKVALEEAARRGQLQVDDEACKLENTQEGKAGGQGQLSSLAKENQELHADLQALREQVSSLQRSMAEANADCEQGMANRTAEWDRQTEVQNEALLTARKDFQRTAEERKSKDAELVSLAESLEQARRVQEDLKETLKKAQEDAESREDESRQEVRDLKETIGSLKERTVELIREKDALWQKSDKLEFDQRQLDVKRLSRKDRFGSKK